MSKEKSNCCDTDNPDCNTNETNCCSNEQNSSIGNKKKIGLGVLLIAITFAVISAFNSSQSTEKPSCSSDEVSCSSTCETGQEESSCCSIK